jgi:hypothetical protein
MLVREHADTVSFVKEVTVAYTTDPVRSLANDAWDFAGALDPQPQKRGSEIRHATPASPTPRKRLKCVIPRKQRSGFRRAAQTPRKRLKLGLGE